MISNDINTDWYGEELKFLFSYSLQRKEDILLYTVTVNPYSFFTKISSSDPNKFKSGLWKEDVIELFLKEIGSESYYEFHIAPSGEWWAAQFSEYRELQRELSELQLSPGAHLLSDASLETTLFIPLDVLGFNQEKKLEFHVSAIFGDEKKTYITSGSSIGGKPDFHLSSLYSNFYGK